MANERIGIEYTDSIDGERDEGVGGRFVLVMIERRKWSRDSQMLAQLEDKVHSYLSFVRDGYLYRLRPQAEGREVGFELQCRKKPGLGQQRKIEELRELCANHRIDFDVVVNKKL